MVKAFNWRSIAQTILCTLALSGIAVSAQAHTGLKESTPGDGAVVKMAPEQIDLEFTAAVNLVRFDVHGPDGELMNLGFTPQTSAITSYSLPVSLMAGAYHVEWAAIGEDGHTVTGEFGFTVDPNAETEHAGGHHDQGSGHHAH